MREGGDPHCIGIAKNCVAKVMRRSAMATNRDASRRRGLALPGLQKKPQRHRFTLKSKATAMLRIESSALERHCRAEIYNAWAWKCIVLKSSGMAQPRHARQRNGIAAHSRGMALHYGAKPRKRIAMRSNGKAMNPKATATKCRPTRWHRLTPHRTGIAGKSDGMAKKRWAVSG